MIYLDNGATSFPKPRGMIKSMNDCMTIYCGNPGRSGHDMSMRTGEEVYKARRVLAEMFHIESAEQIVFTGNTSEALNLGIKGVLLEGDHVITTSMEHNSVLRPLNALEQWGVQQTIVRCQPDGTLNVNSIQRAIKKNTRLIVCTHASNVVGTILPIAEVGDLICKENHRRAVEGDGQKILFMVDGAQSAGSVIIDVKQMNIDMLAIPGHKGLLGPLGTGMLYIREGIDLRHLMEGGTGTQSKDRIQPRDFPEGYEVGTLNAPGIIGLRYSTEYVRRIGVESIGSYEMELIKPLDAALRNMKGFTMYGPSDCSKKTGIVTFNITGNGDVAEKGCEEVASLLNDDYGIAVRGGYHCAGLAHKTIGTWDCGAVRMSVGIYNSRKDIRTAIEALHRISKQ